MISEKGSIPARKDYGSRSPLEKAICAYLILTGQIEIRKEKGLMGLFEREVFILNENPNTALAIGEDYGKFRPYLN